MTCGRRLHLDRRDAHPPTPPKLLRRSSASAWEHRHGRLRGRLAPTLPSAFSPERRCLIGSSSSGQRLPRLAFPCRIPEDTIGRASRSARRTHAGWFKKLRDRQARARVRRLSLGNPGLMPSLGESASELKIGYGPGYRIYITRSGRSRVTLLVGGDKRTQKRDLRTAKALAWELKGSS